MLLMLSAIWILLGGYKGRIGLKSSKKSNSAGKQHLQYACGGVFEYRREEKKEKNRKKNQTEHFFLPHPITQEHFIKQQTPIHRWKIFTCRTWDAGKKSEEKKRRDRCPRHGHLIQDCTQTASNRNHSRTKGLNGTLPSRSESWPYIPNQSNTIKYH